MLIPLVAVYSNGGAPRPRQLKNVSLAGALLLTEDRWYPGTIVSMALQYDPYYLAVASIAGQPGDSVHVRGRVMRTGLDGVGVRFVYLNQQERRRVEEFLAGAEVRGEK